MKKKITLKICLVTLLLMVVGILLSGNSMAKTSETVKVTGQYRYDYAKKVLDIVNQERAKINKPALKMTKELFETANQRAAELVLTYTHDRPDGTSCFTAFPNGENSYMGENIFMGPKTPESAMNGWMGSEGHKNNILGKTADFSTIGVGCFEREGKFYWVQCFGTAGKEMTSYPANTTKTITVPVKSGSVEYYLDSKQATIEKGKNITFAVKGKHAITSDGKVTGEVSFVCDNKDFTWKSENEEIATVVNGVITAKNVGKVTITATKGNTKLECLVTVPPALEKIEISSPEINEIKVGQDMQFDVIYLPEDAVNHQVAEWKSSDETIATVTNGMVKGLKQGKVTITAKVGEFTATREITIVATAETNTTQIETEETEKTETKQEGQEKTKTKRKLDEEPKTGITDTYEFIALILSVSILGIAIIYNKKTVA